MEAEPPAKLRLLEVGDFLQEGRYEIIKQLSPMNRYGGGCVYQARTQLALPSGWIYREVAIKQVYDEPDVRKTFDNEVKQLSKIRNLRGIPYLIESFEAPSYTSWIYVMEYVAGETLATLLDAHKNALSVRRVLEWICDLLNTLEELHKHGFVHKDIKPANIAVPHRDRTYTVLFDFGIAKQIGQTDPTFIGGTRRYGSPEQFELRREGDEIGPLSDLYAVGATLYVLLVGDEGALPPAIARREYDTLKPLHEYEHLKAKIEKVEVLATLNDITMRALALASKDRPRSAVEMREVLEGVIAQMPSATFSIGTQIGTYEITQLVDVGPMSATYQGRPRTEHNNPTVTLRYFVRGSQPDAATVAAFIERGHKVQTPQVSTIISTIDDSARKGTWYVLSHAPGRPLADIRGDQPGPGRIVRWLDQVLDALETLHTRGETIGALHPWSITVDAANQAMLLDWGPLSAAHYPYDLTPYTAPEVRSGAAPTEQSDLFGVAATFYELYSGTLPFDGRAELSASPYLLKLLRRALADDPAQRFTRAAAMRQELKPLLQAEALRAAIKQQDSVDRIVITSGQEQNTSPPVPGEPEQIIPIVLAAAELLCEFHEALKQIAKPLTWALDRHAIEVNPDGSVRLIVDILRTTEDDKQRMERQDLEACLPAELAYTSLGRDQFLLAAISYYLLTGEEPLSAEERQRRIVRGIRDPLKPISQQRDTIPPTVAEAVMSALALPPQVDPDPTVWHKRLHDWFRPLEDWPKVYEQRQKLAANAAVRRIVIYADRMEPALEGSLVAYEPVTQRLPVCSAVLTMVDTIAEVLDAIPPNDVFSIGALHPKVRVQPTSGDARLLLDMGRDNAEQSGAPRAPETQPHSATNQFNLATLAFFALTGEWPRKPSKNDATNDAFLKRLTSDLRLGNALFEKSECQTAEVISIAMSYDPDDRYTDCSEFADRLRLALKADGVLE